jgi:hypothetical protein
LFDSVDDALVAALDAALIVPAQAVARHLPHIAS